MNNEEGLSLSIKKWFDKYSLIETWLSRLPLVILAYFVFYLGEFGNLKGYDNVIIRGITLILLSSLIWFLFRSWPNYRLDDRLPIILLITLFIFFPYHNDWWWWIYHGGGPAPVMENYVDRLDKIMLWVMILVFSYGLPDDELAALVKYRPMAIFGLLFYIKFSTILNFPEPDIDVWQSLMIGPDHLLAGENPYQASYPSNFYHDGSIFFYPPGIILVLLPLRAFGLDIRYLYLLVEFGIALMIYYKFKGRISGELYAIPLLVLPYTYFFIHYAWTEMILGVVICFLILWGDHPKFEKYRPVMFALLGTLKQSMWLVLPFYGLYLLVVKKREMIQEALVTVLTFLAIMLPFLLWAPEAFIYDLWEFPQTQLRFESLTINSYLYHRGYSLVGTSMFVFLYFLTIIYYCYRIYTSPDSPYIDLFKFSMLMQFAFFFMGKLAFMNHYHLIILSFYLILVKQIQVDDEGPNLMENSQADEISSQ